MTLPTYILGDNTDHPNAIYVIRTEFPRFIINLEDEEFDAHDERELETETKNYIQEASKFYDREVARYGDD